MRVHAPLTIYVDEAGAPEFRELDPGTPLKAYVPCAVAIPSLQAEAVQRILPRSSSGILLKSSALELTEPVACQFLEGLLRSKSQVAAILIDPAGALSVAAANNNAALSNERRQAVHHRKISVPSFGYSLLVAQAVINVLQITLNRTGALPSYVDLVLDKAGLSPVHEDNFRSALHTAGAPKIQWGRIEWAHEQDEPLLLVPDLVAGALHRHATSGDAKESCALILRAASTGRLSVQDGYKIALPSKSETNADA